MDEPEKPFSCRELGCGESFTNADRLAVHSKKHDLVLQLGNKGGAFVADQTPTPTRFIRNCEEVGLFQDLQNVNIFDDSFKREMEARSTIHHLGLDNHDNHLTTTMASDDTLHTPHIFPHMPDDSATNLFLNKPEDRRDLVQNRLGNDDIEHSTINKCMKSNTEDNLSSLTIQNNERNDINEKNCMNIAENITQNMKIPARSRLKLMRQNSVDLGDGDIPTITIKENNRQENPSQEGLKSRRIIQRNNLRDIRLPVISISDSSRHGTVINSRQTIDGMSSKSEFTEKPQNQSKDTSLLTVPDIDVKNNLRNSIKGKILKCMSQKSIEMELVRFTNDANKRTVDLNNISIEDMPNINEMSNDPSAKSNCSAQINILESQCSFIESSNSNISSNMLNSNIAYAGKEKKILSNSSTNNAYIQNKLLISETNILDNMTISNSPIHNASNMKEIHRKTVISQKDSFKTDTIDENQNDGYELLLKWPDGKKVYLKEVFRDDDSDEQKNNNNTTKVLPNSLTLLQNDSINVNNESASFKRKLDPLPSNTKRFTQSHANPKLPIKPITSENCLKECLILPQTFITNKLSSPHIMTNSIQVVPISNVLQQAQDILNKNSSLESSPSSSSVINKRSKNSCVIQKTNNTNKPTKRLDPDFSKTEFNNAKVNDSSKTDPNKTDQLKKDCIQWRNRAAVNRYRNRQKQLHKVALQRNEVLEIQNKNLLEKLSQALHEVKRLQNILALHNNCTISVPAQNSASVIQPTEMFDRKFEKKSENIHCVK
ncbi:activating transcription factor-2 isoform X1 [Arctopsyche grandis]|uniref:activating transcription factor-2 isoform X1 n=1 Tax=Arctopsyche grandis TaxID=121162 RepID=UPI00406D71A3